MWERPTVREADSERGRQWERPIPWIIQSITNNQSHDLVGGADFMASLTSLGLSRSRPLPQTHVTSLSQSSYWKLASLAPRPLSHMASLTNPCDLWERWERPILWERPICLLIIEIRSIRCAISPWLLIEMGLILNILWNEHSKLALANIDLVICRSRKFLRINIFFDYSATFQLIATLQKDLIRLGYAF